MMESWQERSVLIVFSIDEAWDMSRLAAQWDVHEGGRYEHRGHILLIHAAPFTQGYERLSPQGIADMHWYVPDDRHVTLTRVAWDPDEGGSEDLMWEALELLAGRSLR